MKDAEFGLEFIGKFDVVVNALDNLEARRHVPALRVSSQLREVNRLCLAAEKPLLEAGSTGHLGQARHW